MEEWWRTATADALEERRRTATTNALEITAWFPQG
jgi:hypothetical protein